MAFEVLEVDFWPEIWIPTGKGSFEFLICLLFAAGVSIISKEIVLYKT